MPDTFTFEEAQDAKPFSFEDAVGDETAIDALTAKYQKHPELFGTFHESGLSPTTEFTTALAEGATQIPEKINQAIESGVANVINFPSALGAQLGRLGVPGVSPDYNPPVQAGVPIVPPELGRQAGAAVGRILDPFGTNPAETGALQEAGSELAGMTTPGMIASVAAAGPVGRFLKVPGEKLLSAAFLPQIAPQIPEAARRAIAVWTNPASTDEERGAAAASVGGMVAMTALMAKSGLTEKGAPNALVTEDAQLHGGLRPRDETQGRQEMPVESRRPEDGQRGSQTGLEKETQVSLSQEDQAYLDAERKSLDVPVDVQMELPSGEPFAGQIATIDRATGKIVVNAGEFQSWLKSIPENRRQSAVRSLLGEERIHLAVPDPQALDYWNNLTAAEKAITRRRYTGTWSGKETGGGQPVSIDETGFGHEALRFRLQQLARQTPREVAEAVGRERWTMQGLTAVENVLRTVREKLGTKASKEQLAILDKIQGNLTTAQAALGARPAALRKEKDHGLDLPAIPDGRTRLYNGSETGSGTSWSWWTSSLDRASSFGRNIRYVDVPDEVARRAKSAAEARGQGGTSHFLDDAHIKEAKDAGVSEPKVLDLTPDTSPESIGKQIGFNFKPVASFSMKGVPEALRPEMERLHQAHGWEFTRPSDGLTFYTKVGATADEIMARAKEKDPGVSQPGALRKGRKQPAQDELFLPPLRMGTPVERNVEIKQPEVHRPQVTPVEIDWSQRGKEPSFRPISDDEAKHPAALGQILVADSRIEGAQQKESSSRRLVALLDRSTGRVEMVSAYRHGRAGAMLVDPQLAGTGKPNRPLASLMGRYKPIYSVLLDHPVNNFHQRFQSVQDFMGRFGDEATDRSKESVYEQPVHSTPGPFGHQGEETLPTDAEVKAFHDYFEGETPATRATFLGKLQKTSVEHSRQLLSGLKKAMMIEQQSHPHLGPEASLIRVLDRLYDNLKTTGTRQEFIQKTLAQGGEPPDAGVQKTSQAPSALRKSIRASRDAAEEQFRGVKGLISTRFARGSNNRDIVRWRDAADGSGRIYARNAADSVRAETMNPGILHAVRRAMETPGGLRAKAAALQEFRKDAARTAVIRSAAKAVIASGGDQTKLAGFLKSIAAGEEKARKLLEIQPGSIVARRWIWAAGKLRQEVEYARDHWNDDELRSTAEAAKRELADEFDFETANGTKLREQPEYLPGRYEGEFFNDNSVTFGDERVLGRNFRQPKSFANYYDAIEAGAYVPKNFDIADLVEHRIRQGRTEVNKRLWMNRLKNVIDPVSGAPIVRMPVEGRSPGPEYDPFRPGPTSDLVYVRHGYADLLHRMTMTSALQKSGWSRAALHATGLAKHGAILILDTFHTFRLGQYRPWDFRTQERIQGRIDRPGLAAGGYSQRNQKRLHHQGSRGLGGQARPGEHGRRACLHHDETRVAAFNGWRGIERRQDHGCALHGCRPKDSGLWVSQ